VRKSAKPDDDADSKKIKRKKVEDIGIDIGIDLG